MKTNKQIKPDDSQTFTGATVAGHPVKTYDDGYGPLWVITGSLGNFGTVLGIVRASTWEDAWSIAEDEVFPDPDPEDEKKFVEEYGEDFTEDAAWQDTYSFRNSGTNGQSCFYEKGDNDQLNPLTKRDLDQWEIILIIEDEPPPPDNPYYGSAYVYRPTVRNRCVSFSQSRYSVFWATDSRVYNMGCYPRMARRPVYYAPFFRNDHEIELNP